jgi:hypothetical protein
MVPSSSWRSKDWEGIDSEMDDYEQILLLMTIVPAAVFLGTIAIIRLARAFGNSIEPQRACFTAGGVVGLFGLLFVVAWFFLRQVYDGLEIACGIVLIGSYCFCVNFLNWFLFTVTETSMHAHLLVEIGLHPGIHQEKLLQLYNKKAIVDARLARLIKIRQLVELDGRLYLRGHWVIWGALACHWLRKILGIPGRPPQEL